jgi:hypothetical protein
MDLEKNEYHFVENTGEVKGNRPDSPVDPENDKLEKGRAKVDLRPEFCNYKDEGCELADSCLNCPFSRCIFDERAGKQRWLKGRRAKEISRLHIVEGKKLKELAAMFGVSERTVQRALKKAKSASPSP